MDKEIIYDKSSEEYNAIKWLENKTINYSDDGLTLHYNLILYNLIINLQQQLKKKDKVIEKAIEYIKETSIGSILEVHCGCEEDYIGPLLEILEDKEADINVGEV